MVTSSRHEPEEMLDRREAQAIAVISQGLAAPSPRRRIRQSDLRDVVERLGCVQLDTISVISRSHETVGWSRLGPYDLSLWDTLYEPAHAVTEYWAHAAAIVPVADLRLHRPVMERFRRRAVQERDEATRALYNAVLERIREQGPLSSLDFEAPEGAAASAWQWYGHKPERRALADLWSEGRLVVRRREAFRRIFDLIERVVPELWDGEVDEAEVRLALGRKALSALGLTTLPWFTDYFRTGGRPHLPRPIAQQVLATLVERGEAVPLAIAGIDEPAWAAPEAMETLATLRKRRAWPTRTTLLSPFDNLVWNRQRDEQLWGFQYRLECYTPAPKRIYGYYSLPILYRGALVGRLDPSFDRRAKLLTIKSFHWEEGVRPHDAMRRAVAGAIGELGGFLGGEPDRWVVNGHPPGTVPENVGRSWRGHDH
ncbi:MAG TPA: crosslink repair DNA glycosylase YcaQ family protein [Thermomicrobiales bacterium]|nr:crosslink repair DNA glycosylase YcaQ family protein [Thermomicrobiales bacterium]